MIWFNGNYGLLADGYLEAASRVLCWPSPRLATCGGRAKTLVPWPCCSRKQGCKSINWIELIDLQPCKLVGNVGVYKGWLLYIYIFCPKLQVVYSFLFLIQYRIRRPKATSERLGRHRLPECSWNHGTSKPSYIYLRISQLEKWAQFTLITFLKGSRLRVVAVPSELRGLMRLKLICNSLSF